MVFNEIAEKFIRKLTAYTKYNINIMDDKGIIIASRNPDRIGTFHEVAFDIIRNNRDIVHVTANSRMLGTKPGVNLPLIYQNKPIGVIGVTGDPDEVHPIALIVKMSMETMLDYEYQHELITKRQTRKEQFVHQLISGNLTESAGEEAKALGYSEDLMRIPILIRIKESMTGKDKLNAQAILGRIKEEKLHTSQDISLITADDEILIFKCLRNRKNILSDYKYLIKEYLYPFVRWAADNKLTYHTYIGSTQNQFNYYSAGYQHCCWLKKRHPSPSGIVFFYDHVDDYLKDHVPGAEYHRIFNCAERYFSKKDKKLYTETMNTLKKNNYNMVASSKDLYVHKNTLAFRFDKIRDLLDMNPVRSAKDREFMEHLLFYLDSMTRSE